MSAVKSLVQKQIFSESEVQDFSPAQRNIIGKKIVEKIRQRTNSGLDVNGVPFRYAPNSEFVGNNLTLTGDMLTMLDVVSISNGIVIGYSELSSQEALQAEGHQEAFQSRGLWKKRFIGLSSSEKDLVLAQARAEFEDEFVQQKSSFIDSFINNLIRSQGE